MAQWERAEVHVRAERNQNVSPDFIVTVNTLYLSGKS
jgi:hypothetical protein